MQKYRKHDYVFMNRTVASAYAGKRRHIEPGLREEEGANDCNSPTDRLIRGFNALLRQPGADAEAAGRIHA